MLTSDVLLSFFPVPALAFDETLDAVDASRSAFELFGVPCLANPDAASIALLASTILQRRDFVVPLGAASMRLRAPGDSERFMWQDGVRRYEVSLSAAPAPGNKIWFLACFIDQTAQIELERGNARARSFLESIMSSLHLGVTVVNRSLRITHLNTAQHEQLAIMGTLEPVLSLIGRNLAEVFPDEAEVIQSLAPDVLDKSAVCGGIVERYEAEGVEHVFSVGFSPLRDEAGGVVGMIRVGEEITDREKMAQDLHQAELRASEADTIRKLMVTLNHEINNSLTAITGNIELLRLVGGQLQPEKEVMLREIATHAERITAVTGRLRNIQQVQTVAYLKDGTDMIDTGLPGPDAVVE